MEAHGHGAKGEAHMIDGPGRGEEDHGPGDDGVTSPLASQIRAKARADDQAAAGPLQQCPRDAPAIAGAREGEPDDSRLLITAAAEIYAMRRARDRHMPDGLASEPAWDMLLALYSEEPAKLPVSSLCYSSGVPMTTALRWIGVLESQGLVKRSRHERDARINLLSLTSEGSGVVERCLKAILRQGRR